MPLFLRQFHIFLRSEQPDAKQIKYFSDGCAGQSKNCKNFINLCFHKEDFGTTADLHFFATSHGKGPGDGLGGTMKRLAARESLQRPYSEQILTPLAFFNFCVQEIKNVDVVFSAHTDYKSEGEILEARHMRATTMAGTQRSIILFQTMIQH